MKIIVLCAIFLLFSDHLFANGTVVTGSIESHALGVTKNYRAYLPEDYSDGETRYPVIYVIHGWGVTEDAWIEILNLPDVADKLDLKAIVVMPDGDRSLYVNAVSGLDYETCLKGKEPVANKSEPREEFCVRTPNYEYYIVDDLVPHIDGKYRTVASQEGRAISGDSAGGFGAMSLALRNPETFSSAASHSGFVAQLYDGPYPFVKGQAQFLDSIDPEATYGEILQNLGSDIENWKAHDPYSLIEANSDIDVALYFDCGIEDEYGFNDLNLVFDELLTSKDVEHEFHSVPGHHDDEFFSTRIEFSLKFHADQFRKHGVYAIETEFQEE